MSTNQKSPINLPEIIHHLSRYLRQQDVLRCLFVSKDWHKAFLPFLWGQVLLKKPLPSNIQRYHHMINSLTINTLPEAFNIQYPNLRSLSLGYEWSCYDLLSLPGNDGNTDVANLILINPKISTLKLFPRDGRINESILQSASELQDLERMTLFYARFTPGDDINVFWRACRNLKKLRLQGTKFARDTQAPEYVREFGIRILKIEKATGMSEANQLELISRCPRLEELVWLEPQPSSAGKDFVQRIAQGNPWPNLRRLTMNSCMSDDEVEKILIEMKELTHLELQQASFGPHASTALLEHHLETLVELNLRSCYRATSSTFRDVLCSCPQLEVLTGPKILANDIAQSEPWACLSLKVFQINVEFKESEHGDKELQSSVFKQLSRLPKLTELYVGKEAINGTTRYPGLDFRLEYGMDQLENLKDLRYFSFRNTMQVLGEEDIEWMTSHWTKLELVSGLLHTDTEKTIELRNILRKYDIGGV
ncbi:hypothetical protein BGX21_003375 [Mortierella sp. AD011]|nr:hypothetical protein BGX20_003233 [Mortierella sp. AD010]KAF9376853.1 hypothetical protein BGX21_003375 [Mortierella sp. AD011]